MLHAARLRHGPFENGDSLRRIGTVCRFARLDIPQLPRRAAHDCLGEECRNVVIVLMCAVHLAHLIGIVVVPDRRDLLRII
jgi:hypothetical protein